MARTPTDRRLTPATDRVALEDLRGLLDRPAWTAGRPARLVRPLADLCRDPGGARDRQVNFGAPLTVIEDRGDHSFVRADRDGYCGWLDRAAIGPADPAPTHRVTAPATHVYPRPDMKTREVMSLSLGAELAGAGPEGRFLRLATGGFVPIGHVGQDRATDPVAVARSLLGTPYLWGGNSRWGIDCSGLVQAALGACGIACPGDSDLQRLAFPESPAIDRGDLLFWPGHVAMAVSPQVMIHATAWTMSVTLEPIADALARIDAAGEGPFLGAHRPG